MLSDTRGSSLNKLSGDGRLRGIAGVILAGGENRRFPEVKALITIGGQTIIERHLSVLRSVFDEVMISTNTPEVFFRFEAPLVGDILPSLGPIAGIHAALSNASAGAVFVVACDMPFVDRDAILCICREYREAGMDGRAPAVIPSFKGEQQPLFGVYHRTILPSIEKAIAEGKTALKRFLSEAGAIIIDEPCPAAVGSEGRVFVNINTLEDYRRVFGVQYRPQGRRSAH